MKILHIKWKYYISKFVECNEARANTQRKENIALSNMWEKKCWKFMSQLSNLRVIKYEINSKRMEENRDKDRNNEIENNDKIINSYFFGKTK